MSLRHACCLLGVLAVGCSNLPENYELVEQTVTVKTADGQEQVIPLSELYDPVSGAPAFTGVLVVDRQRNRQLFVSPDELGGQTPSNARYVLVTSSLDAPSAAAE